MNRGDIEAIVGDNKDERIIDLLMDLWDVMQLWDDAVDGDDAEHAIGYRKAMLSLPQNPFYNSCNVPFLVAQAYYNWNTANKFEDKKEQLHKAYMLRASYYGIIIMVIHSAYGSDEAERISPVAWSYYCEKFEDYYIEMTE